MPSHRKQTILNNMFVNRIYIYIYIFFHLFIYLHTQIHKDVMVYRDGFGSWVGECCVGAIKAPLAPNPKY